MLVTFQRIRLPASCVLVVGLLTGCGAEKVVNRPKVVAVSGVVLYDDKPVDGATVVFVPQGQTNAAVAQTDASGEFHLQTFEAKDGAVPGNYKVTVRKISMGAPDSASAEQDAVVMDGGGETWLLPKKYGDATTSDLIAEVKDGSENKFSFKLSGPPGGSMGGKPANFKGRG